RARQAIGAGLLELVLVHLVQQGINTLVVIVEQPIRLEVILGQGAVIQQVFVLGLEIRVVVSHRVLLGDRAEVTHAERVRPASEPAETVARLPASTCDQARGSIRRSVSSRSTWRWNRAAAACRPISQ